MEKGVKAAGTGIETVMLPMADGGAGTVQAMVEATRGRLVCTEVTGPLGKKVNAVWGITGDGAAAVIEMSAASGLALVPAEKLNPMIATTYGTGELIKAALESGCHRVIVGLGDSATVDGGAGMARALGVKFLNSGGRQIGLGGGSLAELRRIDISRRHPLVEEAEIIGACDVTNPLCGPDGAAAVYGPQKGANPEMVIELDRALENFAAVVKKYTRKDVKDMPGAGAAGGMGAGLAALLNAELRRGIEIICEVIGFDRQLEGADLVLTGEGRLDYQTSFGKTVAGLALKAKAAGVPAVAICGTLGPGYRSVYEYGIGSAMSILRSPRSLDEAMGDAEDLIADAAERAVRLFALSSSRKML
jgi:glycerate kinase